MSGKYSSALGIGGRGVACDPLTVDGDEWRMPSNDTTDKPTIFQLLNLGCPPTGQSGT